MNKTHSAFLAYGAAVLAIAAALLLDEALEPWWGHAYGLAAVFAAVLFTSWHAGTRPAILAALLGLVACELLFVEPGQQFTVDHLAAVTLYVLSVSAVIAFAGRLRTEEARRKSEEHRLAALLDSIGDHFVSYDREWRFTYANKKAAEMLDKEPDELLGRCIWELFPEAVGNQYYRELHQALAEQRVIRSEHYYAPWDRWYENHFYPSADGVTVFSSDITWRKRTEEALIASERRFTRFMQQLPGLAWIKDLEGRYVFVNDGAAKAFQLRPEELLGKTDEQVFAPATAAQFKDNDRRALDSASGLETIETLDWADGTHYSLVSKFPIPDSEGQPVMVGGIAVDITERIRAEKALQEADRRKDEFLATLAHELRNPLAPIRNSLHILRVTAPGSAASGGILQILERQVAHMVRLVDDLLEVSRITRGKIELRKQQVALDAVIHSALEMCRPQIEAAHHALNVSLPAEPLQLDADPVRLAQVFANLLNNAAKYTEDGGQIAVVARREGNHAVVTVRDNGIGIPAGMLGEVFEMFAQINQTLHRDHGGLGIGLALVKRLVELHGGGVEATSEGVGQGSEFTVRLPLALEPPAVS